MAAALLLGMFKLAAGRLDLEKLASLASDPALHAPTLVLPLGVGASDSPDDTPVVFMHGMGDDGGNPGMQSLAKTVTARYPRKYAVALRVADGMASILEPMDRQLAEFVAAVRADPRLAHGFDAVGLSQGNLIVRAYVERVNDPPVRRLVSVCGPQEGIGTCPNNPVYELICPLWKLDKYGAGIAFSGYWKGVTDRAAYLAHNAFLPDINNERAVKNETYRANMRRLEEYVLIEAEWDTMLVPRETSQHGFWPWGAEYGRLVPLEKSEGYAGDWIGLRSLSEAGRLRKLLFKGDHLRFSSEWWAEHVLPVFA
ncbi:hypothetical protein KFE25_001025 [Diacronema lutheri]|uniref:Palmitoyl-protein thioesterase 1 n=2 Tax=Diacronema lutheri TaxID=2081491 RepID=A0A8J5X6N8_DIALT|nr:hypothetical protein KFE25_001025 [Diacronema lutheri]